MSEYWKSTPKYWCKNCSTYVVDTKLGRANHEATGKHQGAVRRALRDLHREHGKQEREQERARREVARLNGIVGGEGSDGKKPGASTVSRPPRPQPPPPPTAAAATSQSQLEQLADLGVNIPAAFRGELAMAGEWTVTTTRVIDDGTSTGPTSARAVGVRKRQWDGDEEGHDEEGRGAGAHGEADVDAAVQGLFKKPRQWGRESRTAAGDDDGGGGDLDSLLTSALAKPKEEKPVKEEDEAAEQGAEAVKQEEGEASSTKPTPVRIKQEEEDGSGPPEVVQEVQEAKRAEGAQEAPEAPEASAGPVLFKKRKGKAGRNK